MVSQHIFDLIQNKFKVKIVAQEEEHFHLVCKSVNMCYFFLLIKKILDHITENYIQFFARYFAEMPWKKRPLEIRV